MRLLSCVTLFCMTGYVLCADPKPVDPKIQEKLVGKWEATEGQIKGAILEFTKEGALKVLLKAGDQTLTFDGKYKILSDDTLELTVKGPDGKEKTDKTTFKFDKADLTITDRKDQAVKFKKK